MRWRILNASLPKVSNQAVINSNVLVALVDSRVNRHLAAETLLTTLEAEGVTAAYFDSVVNETVTVLARRAEEQKRSNQFPALLTELFRRAPDNVITWISGETQRLYHDVVELVQQTGGALNFHDALIALSCRELGFEVIVSYDEDFDQVAWLTRVASPTEVQNRFRPSTS